MGGGTGFGLGIWFWIQADQNNFPNKEKRKKFDVRRVLCWAGGFSWSLNIFFRGLRRHIRRF